jgi:hypothetical protein
MILQLRIRPLAWQADIDHPLAAIPDISPFASHRQLARRARI